MIENLKTV
uniref:Uncharacterized protein n=1 Tax=Arundo donax TaxID=35708 RepID=A0A0A9GUB0_ARUDO